MRQGTKWGVRLPGIGRDYCLYSFLRVSANFAGNQSTFYEDCNHIGTGKKCTSTFSLQKIEFFKLTVGIYIFLREVPLFHKMKMMDPRRFNRLVGFFSFDAVYTVSMFSVCEIMMPWFNFKENNLYFIILIFFILKLDIFGLRLICRCSRPIVMNGKIDIDLNKHRRFGFPAGGSQSGGL